MKNEQDLMRKEKIVKCFLETGISNKRMADKFGCSHQLVQKTISTAIQNSMTQKEVEIAKKHIAANRVRGNRQGGKSYSVHFADMNEDNPNSKHAVEIYNRSLKGTLYLQSQFYQCADDLFDVNSNVQTVLRNGTFYRDSSGNLIQFYTSKSVLKSLARKQGISKTTASRDLHTVMQDEFPLIYSEIKNQLDEKKQAPEFSTKVCLRAIGEAYFVLDNYQKYEYVSVTEICERFKVGRATVSRDIHEVLSTIQPDLYAEVSSILNQNYENCHLNPNRRVR